MCIFCKIVKGEIPCNKIYESPTSIAFLDINPVSKGHCLVLPKKHYDNYLQIPLEEINNYQNDIHIVANKIDNILKPNGMNILSNIGERAGQTVMHTHFHIIPRYDANDKLIIKFDKNNDCNLSEVLELLNNSK